MAEHNQQQDNRNVIPPPALQDAAPLRGPIARVTDYLQDNCRIGSSRSRYDKYRRYVDLKSADLFAQLVTLYTTFFTAQWPRFKRFMEAYTITGTTSAQTYAARVYISGWFHDLYVSNREAVEKLSPLAFTQHFSHHEAHSSYEYDEFLARLNAAIRPTHIQGTPEDTLYIPLITTRPNWESATQNWFNIANFTYNYEVLSGLIQIMKESRIWRMSSLVTNTTGRPSWLFDWHDNTCCAWFPAEGNYNMDDVSTAYIVGVACSPNLGPRDFDTWQPFVNGILPNDLSPHLYERVNPRSFFGAFEVQTLEHRMIAVADAAPEPEASKRKKTTTKKKGGASTSTILRISSSTEPQASAAEQEGEEGTDGATELPYFRLIDWTYHCEVVLHSDIHTRSGALKMLAFN